MSQPALRRRLFAPLAATLLACLALFASPSRASAEAPYVFIDAGHGGPFSNANENGLYEKDVNLAIAMELRQRLLAKGYRVGIDRTGDYAVCTWDIPTWHWWSDGPHLYADGVMSTGVPLEDLQARANMANAAGADLFVSIHCNGVGDKSVTGIETFAPSFDPLGQRLGALVQSEMIAQTGAVDRGDKITNFYVIRWSNMPAILIEAGFLSNPGEASRLGSAVYRWRLARAIATGVDRFFAEQPFQTVYPRVQGTDRYATAVQASRSGWAGGAGTVLLASGTNWPDALAASPLSHKLDAPLLLTSPSTLPTVTKDELARLHPASIVVLGAESAISATVTAEATAAATVGTATVEARRIGGADRYETAALIAEEVGLPANGRVAVVSGRDFPDALSLSPYAGVLGMPILLASGDTLPAPSQAFVDSHRGSIRSALVVGSTSAVPPSAVAGLPAVSRVGGGDRFTTNAGMVRTWGSSGRLGLLVANGLDFPDALVAGTYGAKVGMPLMLVQPRVLPDAEREYLEINQGRVTGVTVFGAPSVIPKLMDWELQKALD
ncbi:MAG TPA: cell wall-binding repeat-containing protein [Coriobacteriia bacterium]|jgi:N-acetylmuramoyl-L-alanine amidase/putative cell wall-binding protein